MGLVAIGPTWYCFEAIYVRMHTYTHPHTPSIHLQEQKQKELDALRIETVDVDEETDEEPDEETDDEAEAFTL